jgi:hypothetical protein
MEYWNGYDLKVSLTSYYCTLDMLFSVADLLVDSVVAFRMPSWVSKI